MRRVSEELLDAGIESRELPDEAISRDHELAAWSRFDKGLMNEPQLMAMIFETLGFNGKVVGHIVSVAILDVAKKEGQREERHIYTCSPPTKNLDINSTQGELHRDRA